MTPVLAVLTKIPTVTDRQTDRQTVLSLGIVVAYTALGQRYAVQQQVRSALSVTAVASVV